jgi:hypothetical protein
LNSTVLQTSPLPHIPMIQEPSGNRCSQSRQSVCAKTDAAVGQTAQAGISDAERLDELGFDGLWVDAVIERSGAYFDVPAAAVRRRTRG